MQNIQRKYQQIAEQRAKIDEVNPEGFIYITSEDNPDKNSVAGTTAQVTNNEAARQVVERIAHLSTPAEVEAFLTKTRDAAVKMAEAQMQKNDMYPLVKAILGMQSAPTPAPAPAVTSGPVQAPVKK